MTGTAWKMIGFMDEGGEIYSHPACESNNMLLRFTSTVGSNHPLSLPNGKLIELNTGGYLEMRGYDLSYVKLGEVEKIQIGLSIQPGYIPGSRNFVQHDGPRTPQTKHKSDSLIMLLGQRDTLDFELKNNILKLKNSKKKLNAMFVAN